MLEDTGLSNDTVLSQDTSLSEDAGLLKDIGLPEDSEDSDTINQDWKCEIWQEIMKDCGLWIFCGWLVRVNPMLSQFLSADGKQKDIVPQWEYDD